MRGYERVGYERIRERICEFVKIYDYNVRQQSIEKRRVYRAEKSREVYREEVR